MRTKSWICWRRASCRFLGITLAVFVAANLSLAQSPAPPQSTPAAQPTKHLIPAFSPTPSKDSPDGGFPPEGAKAGGSQTAGTSQVFPDGGLPPEGPKASAPQAAGTSQVFPDGGFPPAPTASEVKVPVPPPPVTVL